MILVIGPNGNIGKYVVEYLKKFNETFVMTKLPNEVYPNLRSFDFLDETTYESALQNVTKIFFVRPPQLGYPTVFYRFIDYCADVNIKQIVFISLMGVEKNPIPPHAKIEKYIKNSGLNYTFIRPSFFMENLIHPHGNDIRDKGEINVPALKSKTSFISCRDIGEVAATVLQNSEHHYNQAYTITGAEALDYYEIASLFTDVLNKRIVYTNPSLRKYGKLMINDGYPKEYVKVTKYLYLMTRLGTAKSVTSTIEDILGRKPTSFISFIKENTNHWM